MNRPGSQGEPEPPSPTRASRSTDLACGSSGFWLWRVPLLMIVAGAFWSPAKFWLWIPSFLVSGVACLANARRCGRLHCYATGPIYLAAAVYLILALLELVPLADGPFLAVVFGLALLARLSERVVGTYRRDRLSPRP